MCVNHVSLLEAILMLGEIPMKGILKQLEIVELQYRCTTLEKLVASF